MSCLKDPKFCLCLNQQDNCDSILIGTAVGTIVGLCAIILAVVGCSSKVSSSESSEYGSDDQPADNSYPANGKPGAYRLPLKTGSVKSTQPKAQGSDKQQTPSTNDRPGQYYDRVLGKWVDDVKMDEDGPLLKVIEPDPDGIPNLPMDDLERPSSSQPPQQHPWQSAQKIMIPPHYATRRGFGPWGAYYAPPPPPYGYNYTPYQQSNSYMAGGGGYTYPQYHPSGSHHWPNYYVQGSSANVQGWGPSWGARPHTGQPGGPTPSPVPAN